jgi:hypothetical protein
LHFHTVSTVEIIIIASQRLFRTLRVELEVADAQRGWTHIEG